MTFLVLAFAGDSMGGTSNYTSHGFAPDGTHGVFLAISTAGAPEILLQPDSGKLGARDAGSLSTKWFRESDSVPYFEGEQGPDV